MELDQRIEVGTEVLVHRHQSAEVIEISDDRREVTVRLVDQPEKPPLKLTWGDVKLPDTHL